MSILREAKEDKKALLLVMISGIPLGMFLLMRCMHYLNLLPLLLLLPACSFIYFLVWILYASILSRVKNSDVKQILRDDALTYLPSLLLLPLSVFFFIKAGFYPGASPSEEHLKNTVFLFLLMTTFSLIISLKILVHGHFEWLTERIKSDKAFYLFLSLIFILFSAFAYLKLNALEHYGGDIAAYIQRIWFITKEGIPKSTIFFVPIGGKPIVFRISRWLPLYISAPFYLVLQNPASILVAQAFFISITAIPVYWIGRDLLKSHFLGLLLALSFFLNPATQYLYLQAFHNDAFGMAFLAFALYFLYKRKALPFFIFSALMVVCKENFFLVGIFLGLYSLILESKKRITFGIPCLIFSILWAFIIFVVFPSAGGSEFFIKRYSYLGSSMGEALHTITTEPLFVLHHVLTLAKTAYIGTLLFPLAFFPLFSSTIFIALPIFAQNLLSERYPMYSILYQYSAILLPVLYFSAIKAIYKLSKSDLTLIKKIVTKNFLISSIFLILLLSLTSTAIYGPFGYLYKVNSSEVKGHSVYFENFLVESKEDIIAKEIARQIPENASVLVQEPFQILLAEREKIYMFPCYTFSSQCVVNVTPERIDYIILNMNNPRLKNIEGWRDWINQLESNSWRKIMEKDGFIVLKGEGHE